MGPLWQAISAPKLRPVNLEEEVSQARATTPPTRAEQGPLTSWQVSYLVVVDWTVHVYA